MLFLSKNCSSLWLPLISDRPVRVLEPTFQTSHEISQDMCSDISLCLVPCHSISSVPFSCSVVSDSLPSHGPKHASLPCPSPTPRACSNLMSVESVMPYNHLSLCCPLLLPPSVFHRIMVFSNESVLHIRWKKYWSFSFSISPSNEYSGLISFRMTDLISLLSMGFSRVLSNTRVQKHQFFSVRLSLWSNSHTAYDYWKKQLWLRWTFFGKVMSLLFNIQSKLVIACLLIS